MKICQKNYKKPILLPEAGRLFSLLAKPVPPAPQDDKKQIYDMMLDEGAMPKVLAINVTKLDQVYRV